MQIALNAPIDRRPALIFIIIWRWTDGRQLFEAMMTYLLAEMCVTWKLAIYLMFSICNSGTNMWTSQSLLEYFGTMFTFNDELYQMETRGQNQLHFFPTRTINARNVLRHRIRDLLQEYSRTITQKANTHSIESFVTLLKAHTIGSYSYDCTDINCYSSGRNIRWFSLF